MPFPVNVGPSGAIQPWIPTPLADLSLICKVASESGPNLPYLEQVLRQWAMHLQTYYDWYCLMKAALEPVVFLNWSSAYDDQAKSQTHVNIQYNIPIPPGIARGPQAVCQPH